MSLAGFKLARLFLYSSSKSRMVILGCFPAEEPQTSNIKPQTSACNPSLFFFFYCLLCKYGSIFDN